MTLMGDVLKAYEAGRLDTKETLELFAELIRAGQLRTLQESYARTARNFIRVGYITPDGEMTLVGRALFAADGGREGSTCDANPRIDASGD